MELPLDVSRTYLSFTTLEKTLHEEVVETLGNFLGRPQKKLPLSINPDMSDLGMYIPTERRIEIHPLVADITGTDNPLFQYYKDQRQALRGDLAKDELQRMVLTHEQAHDYFVQSIQPQLVQMIATGQIPFLKSQLLESRIKKISLDGIVSKDEKMEAVQDAVALEIRSQIYAINEAFAEWVTTEIYGYDTLFEGRANKQSKANKYDGATLKFFYSKFKDLSKEHGPMRVAQNVTKIVKEYLHQREDVTLPFEPNGIFKINYVDRKVNMPDGSVITYKGFPDVSISVKPESLPKTTVFSVVSSYNPPK